MNSTKIAPFTVSFKNPEEFHILKSEIFTRDVYYFETENPRPFIIDAGAHIGLTTLYFKKLFPAAHILAIEPNTQLIPILQENIDQNGLENIDIFPVALSDHEGQTDFFVDETKDEWWSTGSFESGAWNHEQKSRIIQVKTMMLNDLLTEPVDFLKLDIEGAEMTVLFAASKKIGLIKHMMIEFHPTQSQNLEKLLEFLQQHRFSTQLWRDGKPISAPKRDFNLLYVEAINKKPQTKIS